MPDLSKTEIEVLRYADRYGPGVGFCGRDEKASMRQAARRLVEAGLLRGTYKCAAITDAGRAALGEASGNLGAPDA